MYLQEPPRGDGASSSVNFLLGNTSLVYSLGQWNWVADVTESQFDRAWSQKNAAQTPSDCGVGPEKELFPSLKRQPARELCVAEAWFTTAFFFRMIQLSTKF